MHNNSRTKKTKPGPDQIPQAYLRWALKAAKRFQQLYPHFPRTKPGQSFTTGVRPFGTLFALAASLILSACTVPRPQRGGKAITAGGITQTLTQGDKALITELRSSPLSSLPSPVLFQRIQFAVDANPIAKIAHALYSGGFLKAVSVGFIPIKWEDGTPKTPFRRKYTQQELLEVSAVAIPANPNALTLALKSGAIEKSDLQTTLDILHQTLGASPTSPTAPTGPTPDNQKLLALLRSIRHQLKHL